MASLTLRSSPGLKPFFPAALQSGVRRNQGPACSLRLGYATAAAAARRELSLSSARFSGSCGGTQNGSGRAFSNLRCSADSAAAAEAPQSRESVDIGNWKLASARAIVFAASVVGLALRAMKKAVEESVSRLFSPPTAEETSIIDRVRSNPQLLLVYVAGPLFFAAASGSASGPVNTPLTVVASGMAKWLELYSGVLLVRVLLTWFPNINWDRQPMLAIRDMTDPYLNLFRNILPPLYNVLDLSPMLAFMVLGILTSILNASMAA